MSSGDDPADSDRGGGMRGMNVPAAGGGRPGLGGAAAVGSLRDLLESLRFDMHSGEGGGGPLGADDCEGYPDEAGIPNGQGTEVGGHHDDEGRAFGEESTGPDENYPPQNGHHRPPSEAEPPYQHQHSASGYSMNMESDHNARMRRSNPNITDDEAFRADRSDSDDSRSHSSSSRSGASSASVQSYEDAGYDNEEDYLFDQYGGIGGTAEERAELAEALMHTLHVGPMADDLFYEEVAMCFLRCRERHRMRTRREEVRERKRAKKRREKANGKGKHGRGKKKPPGHTTTQSETEASASEAEVRARLAKMKVDRPYPDTAGVQSEYEVGPDASDDDDILDDSDPELSRISEQMRNANVESDYEGVRRAARQERREARRRPRNGARGSDRPDLGRESTGMAGTDSADELPLGADDLSAPSTPMSSSSKDDDSLLGERGYGDDGAYDSAHSGEGPRKNEAGAGRTEGRMERDDGDDGPNDAHGAPPHPQGEAPAAHTYNQQGEGPVFRVDLTSDRTTTKKGRAKKYPPPPPPPPPPRGSMPESVPMDVDDEDAAPWEETMARGARAAAAASARRNDHESLRREFHIGASDAAKPRGGHGFSPGRGGEASGAAASAQGTEPDDGAAAAERRQRVAALRDEGRTYYINGAYRESVLCYTEAVGVHSAPHNGALPHGVADETLAALYGNRAAALMMTGAYEGASADCERALRCTDAPSATSPESGPAFRSKILCRMARALLKAGKVWEAERAFDGSVRGATEALAAAGHSAAGSPDEARSAEKALNQSVADATLGLADVRRHREAAEGAAAAEAAGGAGGPAADRRNHVQFLMHINAALSVSPGSMELHERKVRALASLKRWAELGNHCERLAAETVKIDGLFADDLAALDPFPDVRPASSLKPDFFERNPDDPADPVALRILSPKAVCDAVVRLPNGILPLYLRSLRLEERYTEAAKAGASIEAHMSNGKPKGSRGHVPAQWLAGERDKLRRTMSWKEKGDTLFRNGDYERAAEKYALCLTIDGDGAAYDPHNAPENDDAGGRLHAVLHCNRAACLMALKRYREAVKECTAALRIHTHYMKAMLRRGRCFARIRQYPEAVAEYERYLQLVHEARRAPAGVGAGSNAACTFDRPADITEPEHAKAKQELADVKKSLRQAAATDQAQRKKRQEQQFHFNRNFKAAANDAARRREAPGANSRKQKWEATGGSGPQTHRPWDAFGGSSPKKPGARAKREPPGGAKPGGAGPGARKPYRQAGGHQQQQQQQQQQQPPPAARAAEGDHYATLGLAPAASSAEIKKAYHKMALKYHPDKNAEEGAADIFRRVKLAYEVLGNDGTRISYDAQRRGGGRR
ncbi:hypothetical protein ACHAXT_011516 [Thalassiosira profunda]